MIKPADAVLLLAACLLSAGHEIIDVELGSDCHKEEGLTHCYVSLHERTTLSFTLILDEDVNQAKFGASIDGKALIKPSHGCLYREGNKKRVGLIRWYCSFKTETLSRNDGPLTVTKTVTVPNKIQTGVYSLLMWERDQYHETQATIRVHVGEDRSNNPHNHESHEPQAQGQLSSHGKSSHGELAYEIALEGEIPKPQIPPTGVTSQEQKPSSGQIDSKGQISSHVQTTPEEQAPTTGKKDPQGNQSPQVKNAVEGETKVPKIPSGISTVETPSDAQIAPQNGKASGGEMLKAEILPIIHTGSSSQEQKPSSGQINSNGQISSHVQTTPEEQAHITGKKDSQGNQSPQVKSAVEEETKVLKIPSGISTDETPNDAQIAPQKGKASEEEKLKAEMLPTIHTESSPQETFQRTFIFTKGQSTPKGQVQTVPQGNTGEGKIKQPEISSTISTGVMSKEKNHISELNQSQGKTDSKEKKSYIPAGWKFNPEQVKATINRFLSWVKEYYQTKSTLSVPRFKWSRTK